MSRLPASVGKYKIVDRLGNGGMSVLYKAEHPTLGTPVVIKKLTLKGDAAHRERFRREATLMMRLRNENVVGVYDHFKEGGGHYLVMEFVDGRPLSDLLAREGALPPREAAWLIGRVALALDHIHEHGVVHRDLKPSNILLGRDGSVKLGDFGIAFVPGGDRDITAEGTALGTPTFMAPEQLEDARGADERSDIWSLGVCFFELITGRKFVTGPTPAAIGKALPDAVGNMRRRLPRKLPLRYRRLLRRTIRLRPGARLASGGAAVRLLGSDAKASTPPPSSLERRLEALLGVGEPIAEPTPEAPRIDGLESGEAAGEAGGCEGSFLDGIRFLFSSGTKGEAAPDDNPGTDKNDRSADRRSRPRSAGSPVAGLRGRPVPTAAAFVLLTAAAVFIAVPGSWDALFRRGSRGALTLVLAYPEGAPGYWLDGAVATIYRESADGPEEAASPPLRPARNGASLASRRVSLPAGAYRVRWSLGDKVSWRTFRLPPLRETRAAGVGTLVLEERLGDPPEFPLVLRWGARDALTGADLEGRAVLDWTRLGSGGGEFRSGGRYRMIIDAAGYRQTTFDIAVSPWRREVDLVVDLWPDEARIVVRNRSGRSVMPRLNGSGRYIDMNGSPGTERIGRLPDGGEIVLDVAPGDYSLAPGLGRGGVVRLDLDSGATVVVDVVGDDDGAERGAVMRIGE